MNLFRWMGDGGHKSNEDPDKATPATLDTSIAKLTVEEEQSPGFIYNVANQTAAGLERACKTNRNAQEAPTSFPSGIPDITTDASPSSVDQPENSDSSPAVTPPPMESEAQPATALLLKGSPKHVNGTTTAAGTPAIYLNTVSQVPLPATDSTETTKAFMRYQADLAPYYLAEYALQGLNAIMLKRGAPGVASARTEVTTFEHYAVPLMQKSTPSMSDLELESICIDLQPVSASLEAASAARLSGSATDVALTDLLYDEIFYVNSLMNWRFQPSAACKGLMLWLLQSVSVLHAAGKVHGSISLQTVRYHPQEGWKLSDSTANGDGSVEDDTKQVIRILCYLCISPEARKDNQPHRLPSLSQDDLLALVKGVPDMRIMISALLSGKAALSDTVHHNIFHDAAVQSQVLLDAKTTMRSMRTGSEDFDLAYNSVILKKRNWRDALGPLIVPAIITASLDHVSRKDFSPYEFTSSASLLRFVANTVDHFEELPLGLSVSRGAFLDVILATFPALIASCYHYMATLSLQHAQNRDCFLVFDAIKTELDVEHTAMKPTLAGYTSTDSTKNGMKWDLSELEMFNPGADTTPLPENSKEARLLQEFAEFKCPNVSTCAALVDGTCTLWHDERELKFASEHVCKDFMSNMCKRQTCPNAHGFAEIRAAMNDTSPICWRWLEGTCKIVRCKYAHTFRRHHNVRASYEVSRASRDGRRAPSMDMCAATHAANTSLPSEPRSLFEQRQARQSLDHRPSTDSRRTSVDQRRPSMDSRRTSVDVNRGVAPSASDARRRSTDTRGGHWGSNNSNVKDARPSMDSRRSMDNRGGSRRASTEQKNGALSGATSRSWQKLPSRNDEKTNGLKVDASTVEALLSVSEDSWKPSKGMPPAGR